MAEVEFSIQGQTGEISAITFRKTVIDAMDLLQEYDSAISGIPRGSLAWYLSRLENRPEIMFGFHSRVKPLKRKDRVGDMSGTIARSLVAGLDSLERRGVTPPYLSIGGMQKVQHMASLIGRNGATGFRVRTNESAVDITTATVDNIGKLLPIRRESIGSVEGKMEGINLHRKSRFVVYHSVTQKAVTCDFDPQMFLKAVTDSLGKRVTVFGTLSKNSNGDTLRVKMERLAVREFSEQETLRSPADVTGLGDPAFTVGVSTEQYLRSIRD